MFIQVVQGKVRDAEHWRRELRRWRTELKPRATGYLGTTAGVTPDGRAIALFRFESEQHALTNSTQPAQQSWWNQAVKAFDGKVTIHNCKDVDLAIGGGSNWAGFVQVVQGRAKDQEVMRRRVREMEGQLRAARPDIMGVVIAWHGDGGFTQPVYFTSSYAARQREAATANDEMDRQYMALMEGPPTFFDLMPPDFD